MSKDYTGLNSKRSDQHKDLTNSRIQKDQEVIQKFTYWLQTHRPLAPRDTLQSLSTGVVGSSDIDCHQAVMKGKSAMKKMVGKYASQINLSRKDSVNNLEAAISTLHRSDEKTADANIFIKKIFRMLSATSGGSFTMSDVSRRNAFKYELSPFPMSIFNEKGFMRKNPKSNLDDAIIDASKEKSSLGDVSADLDVVSDGGFLLNWYVWPHSQTYRQIMNEYITFLESTYKSQFHSKRLYVVFDGYSNECIGVKSYERYRRQEKNIAADVDFNLDSMVSLNQKCFLSKVCNKRKFVDLLAEQLKNYIHVSVAKEDADTLIVRTALKIKKKSSRPMTVIGNDTDLFVLLIANMPSTTKSLLNKKLKRMRYFKFHCINNSNNIFCLPMPLAVVTQHLHFSVPAKKHFSII